ncbi:hypothetical protein B0J14DRAFT_582208 [Halenospora varia]|nr:hypothetical protein B0J14DRAFT_582208 [Halenospora varia]
MSGSRTARWGTAFQSCDRNSDQHTDIESESGKPETPLSRSSPYSFSFPRNSEKSGNRAPEDRRNPPSNTTDPTPLIEIRAGNGNNVKVFHSSKVLLCRASALFTDALRDISSDHLDLPNADPTSVELFINWINTPSEPITYESERYTAEPWPSKAASTWVFAKNIKAKDFERYALSQFIQNCSSLAFGPWEYIEREVKLKRPLRRFSDHWIAWNFYLAGEGDNEFTGLDAAGLGCFVTDKTRDPRTYDIEHWYHRCGDKFTTDCLHHPIARREKLERDKIEEEEPVEEWGRSFELQRQNRVLETSSKNTPRPRSVSPVRAQTRTPRSSRTNRSRKSPPATNSSRTPPPQTPLPPKSPRPHRNPTRPRKRTPTPPPPYRTPRPPRARRARSHSPRASQPAYAGPRRQYRPSYSPQNAPPSDSKPLLDSCDCFSLNPGLRTYFECFAAFIFAIQIAVMIALPLVLAKKEGEGIRSTTKYYSLFVGVFGGVTFFLAIIFPIYCFFGVAAGIATALDTQSVCALGKLGWTPSNSDSSKVLYPVQSCKEMMALTVFIWTSIPISIFHFVIWWLLLERIFGRALWFKEVKKWLRKAYRRTVTRL